MELQDREDSPKSPYAKVVKKGFQLAHRKEAVKIGRSIKFTPRDELNTKNPWCTRVWPWDKLGAPECRGAKLQLLVIKKKKKKKKKE